MPFRAAHAAPSEWAARLPALLLAGFFAACAASAHAAGTGAADGTGPAAAARVHLVGAAHTGPQRVAAPEQAAPARPAVPRPGRPHRSKGPDVARYQHPGGAPIDWQAVAAASGYAFVKATEGTTVVSPWFARDRDGARAAGLPVGAYHFARPKMPLSTAADQARAFLAVAGPLDRPGDLPAVLDLESNGGLAPGELVAWAQEWVRTVQAATGRAPILYTYRNFWKVKAGDSPALNHLPLWIADYSDGAAGAGSTAGPRRPLVGAWPDWAFWQYTDRARLDGVVGGVDMNVANGGPQLLARLADPTHRAPREAVRPDPPTRVRADGGNRRAALSWTPGRDGRAPVLQWRVTVRETGRQVLVDGPVPRAVVDGLGNGRAYTFVVEQRNSAGWSGPSDASPATATDRAGSAVALGLSADRVLAGASVRASATVRVDGRPLPGARVEFWARRGGKDVLVGQSRTGPDGTAAAELAVPSASEVQARWGGGAQASGSASARSLVRAVPVVTAVFPASARTGSPLGVRGTAAGAGAGQQAVLVQMTGTGWKEVGRAGVRADGTFVLVLRAGTGVRSYKVVVVAGQGRERAESGAATVKVLP